MPFSQLPEMTAVAAAFLFIKVSFNGTNAVIPLSNDSIGGDSGGVRYPFFQICSTFAVTCDRPTDRPVQG